MSEYTECPHCHGAMDWEECIACQGHGEYDAHEVEPLDFAPGTIEHCHLCDGDGGGWICLNTNCTVAVGDAGGRTR